MGVFSISPIHAVIPECAGIQFFFNALDPRIKSGGDFTI